MQTIYKIINKIELKNIRYNINENFLIDKYWETNDSRYLSISDEMQYIINDLLKKDVIEIYTNDGNFIYYNGKFYNYNIADLLTNNNIQLTLQLNNEIISIDDLSKSNQY